MVVSAAVAMIGVKSILDVWWTLSGILAGGMLGLFLLGLISRRAKSPAAFVAVLIGVEVIVWMSFPSAVQVFLSSPFHEFLIPVIGTTTIVLAGILVAMLGEPFGTANRTEQEDVH